MRQSIIIFWRIIIITSSFQIRGYKMYRKVRQSTYVDEIVTLNLSPERKKNKKLTLYGPNSFFVVFWDIA